MTVDGRAAPIDALYLVIGNRVQLAQSLPRTPAPNFTPPVLETHRLFILFFDGHIGLAALGRAKDAATDFLQTDFRDGDTAGIVAGGILFNSRLSQDRRELIAAVRRIRADGDYLSMDADVESAPPNVGGRERARQPEGARWRIAANLARAGAQLNAVGAGGEKEKSLVYLLATVQGLERLPGRKNIVFLSNGFPLGRDDARGQDRHRTHHHAHDRRAGRQRISPDIQPRYARAGPGVLPIIRIISTAAPRPLGSAVTPDETPDKTSRNPVVAAGDVLSSLALDTGGRWIQTRTTSARRSRRSPRMRALTTCLVIGPPQSPATRDSTNSKCVWRDEE